LGIASLFGYSYAISYKLLRYKLLLKASVIEREVEGEKVVGGRNGVLRLDSRMSVYTLNIVNDRYDPVTIIEGHFCSLVYTLKKNVEEGEIIAHLSSNVSAYEGYIERFVLGKNVNFSNGCDFHGKVEEMIRDLNERLEEESPLPKDRIRKTDYIKLNIEKLA
jgi:hypothetical protein